MTKFQMPKTKKFKILGFRTFEFVSSWSETDAAPDIQISDFVKSAQY